MLNNQKLVLFFFFAFIILIADYHSKKIIDLKSRLNEINTQTEELEQKNIKLQKALDQLYARHSFAEPRVRSVLTGDVLDKERVAFRLDCKNAEPIIIGDLAEDLKNVLMAELRPLIPKKRFQSENCAFGFNGQKFINFDFLLEKIKDDVGGSILVWIKNEKEGSVLTFSDSRHDSDFYVVQSGNYFFVGFDGRYREEDWRFKLTLSAEPEWIHLGIVQDGRRVKIFVNGEEIHDMGVYSDKDLGAWFVDYENFDNGRLGASNYDSQGDRYFYNGAIRDLRYYSTVLFASEIKEIYNEGLNFIEKD